MEPGHYYLLSENNAPVDRFKKLDLDNSGSLSVDEFMSLPELQQNPLVQRVIEIFDDDGNGEVDFKEFIQGISQFSVKGDKETKLRWVTNLSRDKEKTVPRPWLLCCQAL